MLLVCWPKSLATLVLSTLSIVALLLLCHLVILRSHIDTAAENIFIRYAPYSYMVNE